MTDSARRTCPACARRYGGLVADDCRVCAGVGVLALGTAALARHPAEAVARSVELYLEHRAQTAGTLPLAQRGDTLEAAVLELRSAGVLDHSHDTPAVTSPRRNRAETEVDAYRLTRQLTGQPVPTAVPATLAAPTLQLADARPDRVHALASANGHRSATARAADPLPLDGHLLELDSARRTLDTSARRLSGATTRLANRRTRPA